METGLKDRVAIVTGGSRGIGLAVAQALLAEGARVALLARDRAGLDRAVTRLDAAPDALLALPTDLTDDAQVRAAVERVVAWHGALHVVVNNAGPQLRPTPIADVADDAVLAALQTKLLGAWRVSRAALPALADDGSGRIIMIAGQAAKVPIPGAAVTGVTNAGVLALTGYLAVEARERGVLVNAVSPGLVDTDGWKQRREAMGEQQGVTADEVRDGMAARLGIDRWGREHEIADVVVFLAGDRAAYLTGQVIGVDGGLDRMVLK